MNRKSADTHRPPTQGRAVDDEDPGQSPMDGVARRDEPARPPDIERLEEDRAKSIGSVKSPTASRKRGEP